jgi:hypothetical protein
VTTPGEPLRPGHLVGAGVVGFGVAALLGLIWLFLPATGSDLSAQVAHADFARDHLWNPVDFRWFGGTGWLGYSVLAPPLMAALGVRLVGALATAASAGLLGVLLTRCRVPRPRTGAAVGALCLSANLLVGRLTFTVGAAVALATLLALTWEHRSRWIVLVVGPLLTWAASPLAALFLGVTAAALVLEARRRRDGVVVAAAVLVGLAASAWLGQGGYMPAPVDRGLAGVVVCALLAFATRYPVVRIGALVTGAGIVLALALRTPVGMNALRLPELFGPALTLATSRLPLRWVAPAVVVSVCWLPPLTSDDIAAIGEPSNSPAYYTELTAELQRLPLTGRVEIPPTLQRWESVYVAGSVPLARGWMTQLDDGYNSLFFGSALTATSYRSWLQHNAVQYVATSDAATAEAGSAETALVDSGLPFLQRVWAGRHWTVYRVVPAGTIVSGGTLLSQSAVSVTFRVETSRTVLARLRWSRWLTITGPAACLRPQGTWTAVVVRRPGVYRLSSALLPGQRHQACAPA